MGYFFWKYTHRQGGFYYITKCIYPNEMKEKTLPPS